MDGSGGRIAAAAPLSGPVGPARRDLTIRRVEAVVNAASGSVGPGAADALERIVAKHGLAVRVANAAPHEIEGAVRAAIDAAPDLVVILAGDGTAALAARLAGAEGPMIAPLPGGTMNMLPHALYGPVSWQAALEAALSEGVERAVSGGEVDGRTFYVAAILGTPTLWAKAREAMRARRLRLAWMMAVRAWAKSFSQKLHYTLGDGILEKTEALSLMCPLVAGGVLSSAALEAAALNPKDVRELVRLGFNAVTGDWRADPSVRTTECRAGVAWTRSRIPAVLDGEPCRLSPRAAFRFVPTAFRALAPDMRTPTGMRSSSDVRSPS